jgi:hypothetical protein
VNTGSAYTAPAADTIPPEAPTETAGTETAGGTSAGAGPAEAPTGTPAEPGWTLGLSIHDELAADVTGLLRINSLAGTALAGLPQIAVVDELRGQLLALSTGGEILRAATCGRTACRRRRTCPHPPRGPGLGPPPDSPGYEPSAPLDRYVRARDRRCRFPGCRARPMRCDLDHNIPWPAGPTSHTNLCCLCRHHHRLSHQAPGWQLRRLPDGGLQWTLPSGQTLTSYPPAYGTDDTPPVTHTPAPDKPAEQPDKPAEQPDDDSHPVLGRPARPGDDPAPF